MALVNFENAGLSAGNSSILDNVSMKIETGEIVTIIGPNGAGKSTLLRLLIGSALPSSGRISRKKGLKIGYVPQRLAVDPTLPITALRFLRLGRAASAAEANFALIDAGVGDVGKQQISKLSGGQLQRVMLARALLDSPDLLVLDEATQGLDRAGVAAFYRKIEKVRHERGCGVLMVSHDLHVVMSASDRVICLNKSVCCQGTPQQVLSAPEYHDLFGDGVGDGLALYSHHRHHNARQEKAKPKSNVGRAK